MTSRIFLERIWIALLFCASTVVGAQAQVFTSLVSFDGSDGANPEAALIQATNGHLYGTTSSDFGPGYGSVFEITPDGSFRSLYQFCSQPNCADGSSPFAALLQASNGKFYGLTAAGGANNEGTVFEMSPNGDLKTLYSFCSETGCADGYEPVSGLIEGSSGKFYGMTDFGGLGGQGTLFEITPTGTLRTLYTFCVQAGCPDGALPSGGLLRTADGSFYGVTYAGGAYNSGTVFKLSASGKFTTLYSFCSQQNCTDGELPYSGLVLSSDGNFYGTTMYGGAYDFCAGLGCGTVFEITPAGELTTLRSFCPKKSCFGGANPGPGVVLGSDGNLYGTTESGGTECTNGNPSGGCGTIFRITPSGEFASLYSFDSTDGSSPRARLVQGRDGKFYGSTFLGGNSGGCVSGCGTVFSLAP